MKALLGTKVGMTKLFDEQGRAKAVTVISAEPSVVTQLKTVDRDGYEAVQLGYKDAKKIGKSLEGHLKKSKAKVTHLKEVRSGDLGELKVGDKLDVTVFETGDTVQVTGISKGKGFAGTIKRHNFHRRPMSHGHHYPRRRGSIGSMFPQHVFKGLKMAGRMGNDRVTVKNLIVMKVDKDHNLLVVSGAIPGPRKAVVMVKGR